MCFFSRCVVFCVCCFFSVKAVQAASDVLCSVFVCFFSVKAVKTASVVQLYLLSYQFHFIQNVLEKNMQITNAL